jgi:hypothetical protein
MWNNLPEYPILRYDGGDAFTATRKNKQAKLRCRRMRNVLHEIDAAVEAKPRQDLDAAIASVETALGLAKERRDALERRAAGSKDVIERWQQLVAATRESGGSKDDARTVARRVDATVNMNNTYGTIRDVNRKVAHGYMAQFIDERGPSIVENAIVVKLRDGA